MGLFTPDELGRLTPEERLNLIGQLWDSLDHERLPLTSAEKEELDRRLASLEDDRRNRIPWAAVKAQLERLCP